MYSSENSGLTEFPVFKDIYILTWNFSLDLLCTDNSMLKFGLPLMFILNSKVNNAPSLLNMG